MIEFRDRIRGVSYIDRPGAYTLIQNGSKSIALMKTRQGYLLPGGGVEPNEEIEVALQREIMEELGYQSTIQKKVCSAVQYLYLESERAYFKKIGYFFKVSLAEKVSEPIEPDHELATFATIMFFLALLGTFQGNAVLSVVARLFTYGVVCAAVMTLRRKQPQANAFRLPAAPLISALGLLFVLTLVTQMGLKEVIAIAGVMAIALLNWIWVRQRTV